MRDLNLKTCAICLRTKIKLQSMDANNLRKDYNLVTGLKTVKGKGLPEHLCVICLAYLKRFKRFRDKCHRSHYTMVELLKQNKEISLSTLEALNLNDIDVTPSLSYLKLENVYYETVKFKWVKHNRSLLNSGERIPVHHCSTIDPNVIFEVPQQQKVSEESNDLVKEETVIDDDKLIEETTLEAVDDDFDATDNCDPEPCEAIGTTVEKPDNVEENNIEMLFDSIFGSSNKEDNDNLANAEMNAEEVTVEEVQDDVDGSQFEEEYATVVALSVQEIKAVVDIYKMFGQGKHKCKICSKSYMNEKRLNVHMRMHDIHTSGTFYCSLCSYYYKTEFLLKTHVADKHMYKYICKKCPEVSFDKTSAKQHYIWTHLQTGGKKNSNWYDGNPRPQWMSMKGCKKPKNVLTLRPIRKNNKVPKDFPKETAVPQLEQYQIIQERKNSRNYLESTFKCQLCYRGFRGLQTYSKHMKKHDPSQSGELQCDMCKLHFPNTRHMYKHMRVCHTFKYSCRMCDYVCYNR